MSAIDVDSLQELIRDFSFKSNLLSMEALLSQIEYGLELDYVHALVKCDPHLHSHLLDMANLTIFFLSDNTCDLVTTFEEIIFTLGKKTLPLVIVLAAYHTNITNKKLYNQILNEFWMKILCRSRVSIFLNKRLLDLKAHNVLALAIFFDCAILAMMSYKPHYKNFNTQSPLESTSICMSKKILSDIDYQVISYCIAQDWCLSDLVCRSILTFESISPVQNDRDSFHSQCQQLKSLVSLSNLVGHIFRKEKQPYIYPNSINKTISTNLNINERDFNKIISEAFIDLKKHRETLHFYQLKEVDYANE